MDTEEKPGKLIFFPHFLSRNVHNGRDKTVPPWFCETQEQGGERGASGCVVRRVNVHTLVREGRERMPDCPTQL